MKKMLFYIIYYHRFFNLIILVHLSLYLTKYLVIKCYNFNNIIYFYILLINIFFIIYIILFNYYIFNYTFLIYYNLILLDTIFFYCYYLT